MFTLHAFACPVTPRPNVLGVGEFVASPCPRSAVPLAALVQAGVGPQLGALLNRFLSSAEGQDAIALDLLMHMPAGFVDRRRMDGVASTFVGHTATLKLHVDRHEPPPRNMPTRPHRVFAHDETGEVQLVYFRAQGGWVEKLLPVGEDRYVSGEIGFFQGMKQITHPDYVVEVDRLGTLPLVEPVYPLTHGLSSKILLKLVREVLDALPELPEWIGSDRQAQFRWPRFHEAMQLVHAPGEPIEASLLSPARMRLAYDEYFAGQLALMIVRASVVAPRGIARQFTGEITARLQAALPFALTFGQQSALTDIREDLTAPLRMSRLLQGDVGAEKMVALLAMAAVAESGAQSAMMAPTELLAAQHFRTISPLAEAAGYCARRCSPASSRHRSAGRFWRGSRPARSTSSAPTRCSSRRWRSGTSGSWWSTSSTGSASSSGSPSATRDATRTSW